jgi:hypothetical protein
MLRSFVLRLREFVLCSPATTVSSVTLKNCLRRSGVRLWVWCGPRDLCALCLSIGMTCSVADAFEFHAFYREGVAVWLPRTWPL